MENNLLKALQVRFVKLQFTLEFPEDSVLPKDKVSAIRGGIGEMLLRMNCVHDRQCEKCDFESECIVQKIMYSKFVKKPEFVTTGGSIGYVLECENFREVFKAGDRLRFYLILFGYTIIYFNQIYQALSMLAKEGIGKNHAKFQIADIKDMEGTSFLDGEMINMSNYAAHMLYDYLVFRRMKMGGTFDKKEAAMIFDSPVTLKFQKEYLNNFRADAIISAVRRRIYMLDCFEGIESDILKPGEDDVKLKIRSQECYIKSVARYSTRKEQKIILRGMKGYLILEGLTEELWALLLIGELVHIGKNTSFGFGRYHLKCL